jgi:hypothetical protein
MVRQGIVRKVFEVIFHLSVRPTPANRFELFLAHRVILPTISTVQNFNLIGSEISAGQVPENHMFPFGKAGSYLTLCLALPRLHVIKNMRTSACNVAVYYCECIVNRQYKWFTS